MAYGAVYDATSVVPDAKLYRRVCARTVELLGTLPYPLDLPGANRWSISGLFFADSGDGFQRCRNPATRIWI
jgi:hypothetical protein